MQAVGFPEDDDELIGGRYRIISRLGEGGMGTAYRAWDEQEGVPVVIKIPKKIFLEDPKFAERFYREIRLLQGLTHPHIVPIRDVGEHEGLPYVVMRFLPGGSLSNRRLRDGQGKPRPNPSATLHLWLPAVAEALDYVHSQGVVHRDVKPANIFFDAFWGAYLGDFGIAKIVEESETFDKEHTLTATHMGIGTQEYMCPEQFTPKAVIDGRADQYALAVMVYEMLSGGRPFTGSTAHLIVEVTSHPVPPLQAKRGDLPSSLVQAVHKGLAKNPGDRFATCREFATAVLRDVPLMEDEPGMARLLCPQCANILKLPTEAAGQKGKCPKCQKAMKVADDLGALWLLDEARRQRKASSDAATVIMDEGPETATVDSDNEALAAFKPVSSTTPIGIAYRLRHKASPRLLWASIAGIVLAAAVLVVAFGGSGKQKRQPAPRLQTYEEKLEEALRKLDASPSDPPANEFVGRHWCFREKNWQKGLAYLAKSGAFGLSPLAQQEIDAKTAQPMNPGRLIAAARGWWDFAKRRDVKSEASSAAIKEHAVELYKEHADSLKSESDIAFVNKWLDSDKDFRDLAGNKRPTLRSTDAPATRWPADAVVWENNGHAYKVFKEKLPWTAAKQRCEEMGGHLVVINDPVEQAAVINILVKSNIVVDDTRSTWDGLWIGATDEAREGQWVWMDGSPVQYQNWGPGEPNSSGNFAVLGNHQGGRWDDQPAVSQWSIGGFICEWPKKALPSSAELGAMAEFASATQARSAEVLSRPPLVNSIGMKLRLIPPGTFQMGSVDGDPDERPVHNVTISKPFYLGIYEVTNAQWKAVMGSVPSRWKDDDRPVEQVSWDDTVKFCEKLSALPAEKAAGRGYRLPTEAEWEYACRASSTTRYSFGNDESQLGDYGWFAKNSGGHTQPVGQKKPNAWGLYDMHGNLWEWVSDWYGEYPKGTVTNPLGPNGGSSRIIRGGRWSHPGADCRSSRRGQYRSVDANINIGFRVALSPSELRSAGEAREANQKTETVYLADLPVQSRKSHFFHNKIPWETVGGKHYANTIHIHPVVQSGESQLVFAIDGKYDELVGAVGILDSAKRAASPQLFRIVGDGKELWKSSPTQNAGRGEEFRVNVSSVQTLELHAGCTGPRYGAHCVWIEPVLLRRQASERGTSEESAGAAETNKQQSEKNRRVPSLEVRDSTDSTVTGSQGEETNQHQVIDLEHDGAFGFPQRDATVLCATKDLRVSYWNNSDYIYIQAVLWNIHEDAVGKTLDGKKNIGGHSDVVFEIDGDGKSTKDRDRNYSLNPWPALPGLRYSVWLSESASTGLQSDSKGRGSIRFVSIPGGKKVRVDSFLIPLSELRLELGDSVQCAYYGTAYKPFVILNSIGFVRSGNYYSFTLPRSEFHKCKLEKRSAAFDPQQIPEGREATLP